MMYRLADRYCSTHARLSILILSLVLATSSVVTVVAQPSARRGLRQRPDNRRSSLRV
jgi:hypothetical protein